jgi:hypothetical protein
MIEFSTPSTSTSFVAASSDPSVVAVPMVEWLPVPALRTARQEHLNDTMTGVLRMWLSSINPTYRRSLNSTYRRAN